MCVWCGQRLFLEVHEQCACVWAGRDRRPSELLLPSWSSHVHTLYVRRWFKSDAVIRPRPWPALILTTHPKGRAISQLLSRCHMLSTWKMEKKMKQLETLQMHKGKLSKPGGKRSKCSQSWIRPLQRSAESAFCGGHWGTKCYYSCSADGGKQNAMAGGVQVGGAFSDGALGWLLRNTRWRSNAPRARH